MNKRQVAAMLRRDQDEWDKLVTILDAHLTGTLHSADSPPWTARDVYAHLARWINRSIDELEVHLKGGRLPPVPGTDDEINARWAAEDSGLSLEEARTLAGRVFTRRVHAIRGIPADGWDARAEALAQADGWKHYAAHRRAIVV